MLSTITNSKDRFRFRVGTELGTLQRVLPYQKTEQLLNRGFFGRFPIVAHSALWLQLSIWVLIVSQYDIRKLCRFGCSFTSRSPICDPINIGWVKAKIVQYWALFHSDSRNINRIAQCWTGGERASKTAQFTHISYCDTIRTQICNWSPSTEVTNMRLCWMQNQGKQPWFQVRFGLGTAGRWEVPFLGSSRSELGTPFLCQPGTVANTNQNPEASDAYWQQMSHEVWFNNCQVHQKSWIYLYSQYDSLTGVYCPEPFVEKASPCDIIYIWQNIRLGSDIRRKSATCGGIWQKLKYYSVQDPKQSDDEIRLGYLCVLCSILWQVFPGQHLILYHTFNR